jgi:dihydroflavonol-4-reductase
VGERYILGNHNVTWKQFFETVGRVANVRVPTLMLPRAVSATVAAGMELWADHVTHAEPLATYRSVRYAQKTVFFSNAKARRELALPSRPLEETIARAVAWFRTQSRS